MTAATRRLLLARMFGSAILMQALLSATSLLTGLLLIRHSSDTQYGYFVLVVAALLLATGLQGAFIQPSLVVRLTAFDRPARASLVGSLYHEQRRAAGWIVLAAAASIATLRLLHVLDAESALVCAAALPALLAGLARGFFRLVLLAYRRPEDVLVADLAYAATLTGGIWLASRSAWPAAMAALALSVAALAGSLLLARRLWRHEPWNRHAPRGRLREFAPVGVWSVAGSAVHWSFSQGYTYLVAATLSVPAVAALAATRLLMMPVNLLSTGIGSLMLPTTCGWLRVHPSSKVFARLVLFAIGVATLSLCYFGLMWSIRDWLFSHVLHKAFAQRDLLLQLWGVVFLVTVCRDQLVYLLVAQGRFRSLAAVALASAVASLLLSYVAMLRLGKTGAVLGVLTGELLNVGGILLLSRHEIRARPAPVTAPA